MAFITKFIDTRLRSAKLEPWLQSTLDFTSQPLVGMAALLQSIALFNKQAQILFLQDYRNLFYGLPTESYQNEEQKSNVIAVLQKQIDELVYSEEDEEYN
jgi:type III secretion system TyeA family effector delivery regulator